MYIKMKKVNVYEKRTNTSHTCRQSQVKVFLIVSGFYWLLGTLTLGRSRPTSHSSIQKLKVVF